MEQFLKVEAHKIPMMNSIRLWFYKRLHDGRTSVLTKLEFSDFKEVTVLEPDGVDVSIDTAQQLMDSLWDCGMRPSEGSGSAGSLRATENHLKDMKEFSERLMTLVEKSFLKDDNHA